VGQGGEGVGARLCGSRADRAAVWLRLCELLEERRQKWLSPHWRRSLTHMWIGGCMHARRVRDIGAFLSSSSAKLYKELTFGAERPWPDVPAVTYIQLLEAPEVLEPKPGPLILNQTSIFKDFDNFSQCMPTKWLQERSQFPKTLEGPCVVLELY